jgi:hypothetical protein
MAWLSAARFKLNQPKLGQSAAVRFKLNHTGRWGGKKARAFNRILRLVTHPIPFSEPGASQGLGVGVPENKPPDATF